MMKLVAPRLKRSPEVVAECSALLGQDLGTHNRGSTGESPFAGAAGASALPRPRCFALGAPGTGALAVRPCCWAAAGRRLAQERQEEPAGRRPQTLEKWQPK
jgi:hypothetical protein